MKAEKDDVSAPPPSGGFFSVTLPKIFLIFLRFFYPFYILTPKMILWYR